MRSRGGLGGGGRGLRAEQRRQREEVAGARRTCRDQVEDFGDQTLLDRCFLQRESVIWVREERGERGREKRTSWV